MNPIKATTKFLNETTDLVNSGKHLAHACGIKHDKHHDIH